MRTWFTSKNLMREITIMLQHMNVSIILTRHIHKYEQFAPQTLEAGGCLALIALQKPLTNLARRVEPGYAGTLATRLETRNMVTFYLCVMREIAGATSSLGNNSR